jgi:hypothetical protein
LGPDFFPYVEQNAFAFIVKDAGFHVLRQQTHVFSSPTFQSSRWQVDIVVSMDGIWMLVNIVIINPIRANLVL